MWDRLLDHLAARRGWRLWVTAVGLGVLAALAMPPVHAVPVLLLAVPGLLAMVGAAVSWKRACLVGFAWGWGFFAAGLYWITHAILTDVANFWWLVPIAVPALALPLAVFVAGPAALAWRVRAGWRRPRSPPPRASPSWRQVASRGRGSGWRHRRGSSG